ncbi:MAG: condensation domain-containing protein, partial [Rhizonema sp. NSF051]|nr:condensation domain-containing protein [Rhizonema sp. NSF051]
MQTDIIEGFELSPQQKRLWLLQQNNLPYWARLAIRIKGNLNVKILKESLYNLIDRHEILRTTFHSVPDHKFPIQSISDRTSIQWQEIDLRSLSIEKQEGKIEEFFQQEGQYSFNLEQESLVRLTLLTLTAQKYILLLTLPTLCADTKTLGNIVKEISSFYVINGQNKSDSLPIQYVQFSAWQNEILEATGTGYWREKKICDFLNFQLPFEVHLAKKSKFKSQFLAITLSPKTLAIIKDFVQKHNISTFVFFQTCWHILLWHLTQKPDIVIGTICDGRSYEGLDEGLGLFAKYLPIHCHLEDDDSFIKTLQQVDQSTREAYAWQEYFAWEQIVEKSENFDAESLSLFYFDFEEQYDHYSGDEVSFTTYKQYTCIDRF